jgi:hypothetical protein
VRRDRLPVKALKNGPAATLQQRFPGKLPKPPRIRAVLRFAKQYFSIGTADYRIQMQLATASLRIRPDRNLATTTELFQQGPFASCASMRGRFVEKRHVPFRDRVSGTFRKKTSFPTILGQDASMLSAIQESKIA